MNEIVYEMRMTVEEAERTLAGFTCKQENEKAQKLADALSTILYAYHADVMMGRSVNRNWGKVETIDQAIWHLRVLKSGLKTDLVLRKAEMDETDIDATVSQIEALKMAIDTMRDARKHAETR